MIKNSIDCYTPLSGETYEYCSRLWQTAKAYFSDKNCEERSFTSASEATNHRRTMDH